MNRQTPEFDQRIADWLEVDPTIAPPDVMATVRAALPSIPQARRGLPAPGRFPLMTALSRTTGIAAVALVAVVGAGGLLYLNSRAPGDPGQLGPGPTPTLAATPAASPLAATEAPTARPIRMQVQGDAASWTAVVPPGWSPGSPSHLTPSQGAAGPSGIAVAATGAVNVPSDPCDGVGEVSDATSPADVVADLEAREDLTVSNPIVAELGGYSGLQVNVEVPADIIARCGTDFYIVFAEPDGSGFYAQGPSNRMRIWVLDVEGRPVVFFLQSFAATPAADVAAAQRIVDSIVIAP